jgi:hypothetical protein
MAVTIDKVKETLKTILGKYGYTPVLEDNYLWIENYRETGKTLRLTVYQNNDGVAIWYHNLKLEIASYNSCDTIEADLEIAYQELKDKR